MELVDDRERVRRGCCAACGTPVRAESWCASAAAEACQWRISRGPLHVGLWRAQQEVTYRIILQDTRNLQFSLAVASVCVHVKGAWRSTEDFAGLRQQRLRFGTLPLVTCHWLGTRHVLHCLISAPFVHRLFHLFAHVRRSSAPRLHVGRLLTTYDRSRRFVVVAVDAARCRCEADLFLLTIASIARGAQRCCI